MRGGEVDLGGFKLVTGRVGAGVPIVLAHGLTATRRYVTHGSQLLERSGFDVLSYDARGHGESDPSPTRDGYKYRELADDLRQVMDACEIDRAVLAGVSMGAATVVRFALDHPDRVSALIEITPAHMGTMSAEQLERWNDLADGLERGGVDGFMTAYGEPRIEPRFQGLVKEAIRQRLERHLHPQAVADAMRVVPADKAFDSSKDLRALVPPTLVVGSQDDLDPDHPLDIAQLYAEMIPISEFVVEERGTSPLAWRGAHLSRAIIEFVQKQKISV